MLSGVLNSDIAVQVSIRIMNTFVAMRKAIASFAPMLMRLDVIERRQMTPDLTPREVEVMEYLRAGLTNETIAQRMGITRDTVKLHLKNIFVKFDVGDRISALREAVTRGFLR